MARGNPRSSAPVRSGSIRGAYAEHPDGAEGYYAEFGSEYRNPHEEGVRAAVIRAVEWLSLPAGGRVLDLAAGSGEVTLALRAAGVPAGAIDGADPWTGAAYRARTGAEALPWSFSDIAAGRWDGAARGYDAIFCSMALHLCEPSRLPALAWALAGAGRALVVITPHKRPELRAEWGWSLRGEELDPVWRLRSRWYVASRVGEGGAPGGW